MGLRKHQRNEIFEAIEAAKLSPGDFDWEAGVGKDWFRHRSSEAYFVVEGDAVEYTTHYVAGDGPAEHRDRLSWFRVTEQVKLWLSNLKWEIETPDLWGQLRDEADLLNAAADEATENTPFTPAEQVEIKGQLRELTDYVRRTYQPSGDQMQLLEERLDYLAAATGRVGRKDWFLMVAGVMLGYVVAAALPPEAARDIIGTLLASVSHILGGGPLGLPPG